MKTKEEQKVMDLGPGMISESSMDESVRFLIFGNYDVTPVVASDESDFVLSSEEWLTIQCYVAKTLGLPNNEDKFRTFLGSGAPDDISDFTQLIGVYDKMIKHVTEWQDHTFPASVSLASDIYNYSMKVETYYTPILPLADILVVDPGNQKAKDKLSAILSTLSREARDHQVKAAEVAAKIKDFANRTLEDKIELSGNDGKSGLSKYYADKYGDTSENAKKLAKSISDMQAVLDKATEEYNHDVVVAATTPSYCWVLPPLGLVAAAIVAGIYGDKAVKALDNMRAAEKKIKELKDEERVNANLLLILNTTNTGLAEIVDAVNTALPLIQKIEGTWMSIADDLDAIVKIIEEDIQKALPIIMDLGVENAIKSWKAVGKAADKYRQNAYITIQ